MQQQQQKQKPIENRTVCDLYHFVSHFLVAAPKMDMYITNLSALQHTFSCEKTEKQITKIENKTLNVYFDVLVCEYECRV